MKFDDTRWQEVRRITTETPGTFSNDVDWAGTFVSPGRELLSSAPLWRTEGRGSVSRVHVCYAWFAAGVPVARGSATADLSLVKVWKPSQEEGSMKVVTEVAVQDDALANAEYIAAMRGGCEYTIRVSDITTAPGTADELRVYAALA
jgi:hypothetical protein